MKLFSSCFSLFLCFLLSAFELHSEDRYAPDMSRIRQKGILTVAMNKTDVYPFFYKEENELKGFDVEIAKDIARRLHLRIKFNRNAGTFNEVIEEVALRKADISVSMLSNTLERAQLVAFTKTYITLYQTLLINRKSQAHVRIKEKELKWLNKREINLGVLAGSAYVEFARNQFPDVSLILFDDTESMFQGVNTGKVIAVLTDNIDSINWFQKNAEAGLFIKTIIQKNKPDPLSIAVHWQDHHLLRWLNYYLDKIQEDGTLNQFKSIYFHKPKKSS